MCFLNQKKGLETYIVIIFIFSVIISLFFIFISTKIYGEEHEDCKFIKFEIINACKKGKAASFTVDNAGEKIVNLEINGVQKSEYVISVDEGQKNFNIGTTDESVITLIPYLNYGTKIYVCSGKTQKINSEVLISC